MTGRAARTWLASMLVLLSAGGCQRVQVGGQTLAVVNGAPISRDDVDLELALLPPGERDAARTRVLQDLIDRKLFAQDAEARGEQRGVTFVRLDRRWHELLLAQRTADLIAARAGSGGSAQTWLAAHPEQGPARQLLVVETLAFARPPQGQGDLAGVREIAGLRAMLAQRAIPVTSRIEVWDTATASPVQLALAMGLTPGRVRFAAGSGTMVQACALLVAQPAPLDRATALAAAERRLASARQDQALDRHRAALRAGASIQLAP